MLHRISMVSGLSMLIVSGYLLGVDAGYYPMFIPLILCLAVISLAGLGAFVAALKARDQHVRTVRVARSYIVEAEKAHVNRNERSRDAKLWALFSLWEQGVGFSPELVAYMSRPVLDRFLAFAGDHNRAQEEWWRLLKARQNATADWDM